MTSSLAHGAELAPLSGPYGLIRATKGLGRSMFGMHFSKLSARDKYGARTLKVGLHLEAKQMVT